MKVISTLVAAMLSLSYVWAADYPIDKGSFTLEGSMFMQYQGGDLYQGSSEDGLLMLDFSPDVKYFVSPGAFVGLSFSLQSLSQGNASADYLRFGPTIGYFGNADPMRKQIPGTIYPFFTLFGLIGNLPQSVDMYSFGGRIGALYMLSDAVGFDFSLKGSFDNYQYRNDSQEGGYTLTLGVGMMSFIY